MAFRDLVLEMRKRHGLSQEDLAGRLFVTRQAVSRWENGETMPALDTLRAIGKMFGVGAANLRFLAEWNAQNGTAFSEEEARVVLRAHLAGLKRWREGCAPVK